MKSTFAIYPAIMENTEDSFMKCMPHILMHESYNTSISTMSNSFHNIIVVIMKSISAIFVSCTEAITSWPQIVTYAWLWKKNGAYIGPKVAP